jgi:hypothetical protein
MVSVLALSVVDREFESLSGQTKVYKIGKVASPLRTHHYGERIKPSWLGTRIMCQSATTCLPADNCFSEIAL